MFLAVCFLILCFCFLLYISNIRTKFLLLPIVYLSVCIYTIIGTELFTFAKNVPFDFYDDIKGNDYFYVYLYYLLASFSFYIGIYAVKKFKVSSISINLNVNTKILIKDSYIYFCYFLTLLLLHLGHGVEHLYFRYGYTLNGAGNTTFRILYTIFLPFTSLLLPFVKNKWLRLFLTAFLYILVQGTSSRNLVIIPSCYLLGSLIRDSRIIFTKSIVLLFLIGFSVTLAMQYRYNDYQGVWPNIVFFINYGIDTKFMTLAINYLSSYSIFATAVTLDVHSFDFKSMLLSINPMPSNFIDIEYMIDSQKLNINSPFPAIAILALGGWPLVLSYYFFSGVIWTYFGDYLARGSKVLSIFVVMLFVLFTVLSLQYNLRGVTRFTYYLIALCVLLKLLKILKFNYKKYKCRNTGDLSEK
ncbi:hypothetical protein ACMYQ1_14875 [Shewanella oncorhynchi]|uniref:hypothetical protein n=1 Tax=Shewanella oncorhynchi TaxID=2726434 RepID=UPI0039F126AC